MQGQFGTIMKITNDRKSTVAVRGRNGVAASAAKKLDGPVPHRSVADVAQFLGITDGELTENVKRGLSKLIEEVDRLNTDNAGKDRRIAYLERLADEDSLTPVLNRRAFVRELSRMMAFAKRYGSPSSVLFLDVDGMKEINDGLGHGAGDAALGHVAQVLVDNVRATDVVGRLGGDEFGVLLAQADQESAVAKGEKLRSLIESAPATYEGQPLRVAVSVGAYAFQGPGEPQAVLQAADAAMYQQKRSARAG